MYKHNLISKSIYSIIQFTTKHIYNSKCKKIANREGDKIDENLIGLNEINSAFFHKFNKKEYIILDYKKNNCRDFKDSVSSRNSAKLSNKEIKDLILSK